MTRSKDSKCGWFALAILAAVGWYGVQPSSKKQDRIDTASVHDAGVWVVDQLDLDARRNPRLRNLALTHCVGPNIVPGGTDWRVVKGCYERMARVNQ